MRRVLLIACAAIFIDVAFFAAVTPLIPGYRDDLGISETAAGMLAGSYAAGTLVFAIPGGIISARIGPRLTMLAGLSGPARSAGVCSAPLMTVAECCSAPSSRRPWSVSCSAHR